MEVPETITGEKTMIEILFLFPPSAFIHPSEGKPSIHAGGMTILASQISLIYLVQKTFQMK
jgi:hypothetical protein